MARKPKNNRGRTMTEEKEIKYDGKKRLFLYKCPKGHYQERLIFYLMFGVAKCQKCDKIYNYKQYEKETFVKEE